MARTEITYKQQGNGSDSWRVDVYDMREVEIITDRIESVDEQGNQTFTDVKKLDKKKCPVTELKEVLVNSYITYEDPNESELARMIKKASPEEIAQLKELLAK